MCEYRAYKDYRSIALVLCSGVSDFRMVLAARHLERAGYHVEVLSSVESWRVVAHDLFIICRPGVGMLDFVGTCLAAGKPVVIDMDDDFMSIPKDNPAYQYIGAGADGGMYHTKLTRLLQDERVKVTYASPELIIRYNRAGYVMPNPWDDENERYRKVVNRFTKSTVIGWAGTQTHREDFKLVLPALLQLVDENPNVNVFIGGDDEIYTHFKHLDPKRRMFMPYMPYEIYPVMMQVCDVWLAPLVDNHFNRAKSDIKIIDALAARIPWVVSNLPQYEAWLASGTGFLVPDNGWYNALKKLVDNPLPHREMVDNGVEVRAARTASVYGGMWVRLVRGLLWEA